jgi:hypothetical protein
MNARRRKIRVRWVPDQMGSTEFRLRGLVPIASCTSANLHRQRSISLLNPQRQVLWRRPDPTLFAADI